MKPKHIIPALLTAITLSNTACDPIKQGTKERVDLIMALPQSDVLLAESNAYYDGHPDFESLTGRQQTGKVMLRTLLAQLAQKLQKGEYFQEFCEQILHSDWPLISNSEVRLNVTSNTGVDMEKIDFGEGKWIIFTPGWLLNRVLEDPKVTSVALIGDTLSVTVEGKESSLVTLNKYGAFAEEEWKKEPIWEASYTFSISPETVDPQSIAAQ